MRMLTFHSRRRSPTLVLSLLTILKCQQFSSCANDGVLTSMRITTLREQVRNVTHVPTIVPPLTIAPIATPTLPPSTIAPIPPPPLTPSPIPPPTLSPTISPAPPHNKNKAKGGNRLANKIFGWSFVALSIAVVVWAIWTFRFEIGNWCQSTWTSTRRYGCRGCIRSLKSCCCRRRDSNSNSSTSLNQIVFEESNVDDLSRGLISSED